MHPRNLISPVRAQATNVFPAASEILPLDSGAGLYKLLTTQRALLACTLDFLTALRSLRRRKTAQFAIFPSSQRTLRPHLPAVVQIQLPLVLNA
ncbi:MAG TPA: hypothetical protein VFP60_15070 [Pseudolabrys sp.]|nr:hypothetical protein [Pseudolabrys sp.]